MFRADTPDLVFFRTARSAPKIALLALWPCSYWSRSGSRIEITLGFRIPSKPNPATRSGLGSFLHPPSRKTPTPFSVKMFAVAAQTTVRATAQVKATKVAAKQQKSAYVHPRFPAFLISRRSSSPAIAGKSAREARRRRRRARGDRTRARRLSTRHETARAARRDGRPRLQASSPSSSVARTTTSFVTPQKTVARDTHQTFSKNAPPAVPSPPRLPAPPPRCSCSRPPPWRTA